MTLIRMALAVAAVAGAIAPARADFVLDDFSTPNPAVTYAITATNANPFSTSASIGSGVTRTATVNVISGLTAFAATGYVGTEASAGAGFSLSTASGSTAVATLSYAYGTPADFQAGGVDAVRVQFTFADLNVPYSFVLRDADGATSTITGLATSGPGTYTTNLSSFTGVDLTRVSGFDIVLNRDVATSSSTVSADFTLSNVSVVTRDTNVIPAPPAALLALAAVPVFALRRRFAKA